MNPEATLSKRSGLVDAVNRVLPSLYRAGALRRPQFDIALVKQELSDKTGLSDFGDAWFERPLTQLVSALQQEAKLNNLGAYVASGQIRKVLKDRLHAAELFRRHPEIDARRIVSPVIVVGPMRSGTTRLHRLLAADERFAHVRSFETVNPVPEPDFMPGDTDRRSITGRLAMGAVHLANPVTAHIHPSGPYEPEEELGLLVRSFWGMKHEAQWQVPSYGRWTERHDATPAYEYMARLLKLIGWARGEDETKPWVLKTPQHMLDLSALLKVFPDARIIFTHRAPRSVVGSSCSLVWNQMIIHSDQVEAEWIGKEWLRKSELQIESMREARKRISHSQRMDVRFEEMERSWPATMRDIYDFLDMEIDPALGAMQDYIEASKQELHRHPHHYSLESFGLDEALVTERFRSYVEAFDLQAPDDNTTPDARSIHLPDLGEAMPPYVSEASQWRRRTTAGARS